MACYPRTNGIAWLCVGYIGPRTSKNELICAKTIILHKSQTNPALNTTNDNISTLVQQRATTIGQLSKHNRGGSHKQNGATFRRFSSNARVCESRKSLYTRFSRIGARRRRVLGFSSASAWGRRAHAAIVAGVLSFVVPTVSLPPPLSAFLSCRSLA